MKDNINQILNISKFVMGLVGVSLCVWLVAAKYPESGAPLDIINAFVKDSPWSFSAISYVNFLIGVALITVIGFFIYQLIIRPKKNRAIDSWTFDKCHGVFAFVFYWFIRHHSNATT